ncbi:hypothetical protein AVEN_177605-1 [Araneus ventricosus]|uniref:Uncharacterized protein n=1 Tax=Araneus ventricosus TaxID=182803 RepID=A0A4Y2EJG4_ARAVE|nr:hypothetical protein AVEN_177605-1 [Araneus ventricosus]
MAVTASWSMGSRHYSIEDPSSIRVWNKLNLSMVKCPPAGVEWKFGETTRVLSSSSERDSKFRGPFQNSLRDAFDKWDVNTTKLS